MEQRRRQRSAIAAVSRRHRHRTVEDRLRVGRHGSRRLSATADGRTVFLTSQPTARRGRSPRDRCTWRARIRSAGASARSALTGARTPSLQTMVTYDCSTSARAEYDRSAVARAPRSTTWRSHATGTQLLTSATAARARVGRRAGNADADVRRPRRRRGRPRCEPGRPHRATASEDGKAILWDLAGDRRLDRPLATRAPFKVEATPRGVAVSPDGRTSPSPAATVPLTWSPPRRCVRGDAPCDAGFAASVDFSPDGRLLAVAASTRGSRCGTAPASAQAS